MAINLVHYNADQVFDIMCEIQVQRIRNVIFDLDGVIVRMEDIHRQAYFEVVRTITNSSEDKNLHEEILNCFGQSEQEAAACISKCLNGRGFQSTKNRILFEKTQMTKKLLATKQSDEILIPGVVHVLKKLQAAQVISLSLYSGSLRQIWNQLVSRFPEIDVFRRTLFSEEISAMGLKGKPHPDGYRSVIEMEGSNPTQSLIVEDSPSGITAALKAGVAELIVLMGYMPPNELISFLEKIAAQFPRARIHVLESWKSCGLA